MRLADAVGKRIAIILQERGIKQYGLSKLGGIPRATISVLIAGKHNTMQLDTIYQIAATLDMSLAEFFNHPIFDEVTD